MSIKPRGKGFEVDVKVKDFPRFRKIYATMEEATRAEAEVRLSHLQGKPIEAASGGSKRWTLAAAVEKCHNAVWLGTKSEDTAMKNIRMAMDFFGKNVYVNEITTQRVADWVNDLRAKRNSNGTINRKISALSKVLKYAFQNEALEKLPYMPRQRESQGRLRFVSEQEEVAILNLIRAWSDDDLWDCVATLLDTGFRMGELLKIEGQDIRDNQITVWDTKNGRSHTVPMTARVATIIERRQTIYGNGQLFPHSYNSLEKRLKRVLEHLHLDDVHFHTLRHTFASRLVQRGVPIQTVSKLLNHSTLQMTMRYAHLAPSNLTDAVRLLEISRDEVVA